MIVRGLLRLVSLALLAAAGWRLARLIQAKPRSGDRGRPVPPAPGQPMVRDRVCNTFLPRSSAIEARVGGQSLYFCSDQCKRRFLQGSTPGQSG